MNYKNVLNNALLYRDNKNIKIFIKKSQTNFALWGGCQERGKRRIFGCICSILSLLKISEAIMKKKKRFQSLSSIILKNVFKNIPENK